MLTALLASLLLLAVVGAFAARIGLAEGRIEAAEERQELDHPLLRDVLGLPELRRVPDDWHWNPALIRSMEQDVFEDTEGFWFHPLPGEPAYAEALALNPHWPADKVLSPPKLYNPEPFYDGARHRKDCRCPICASDQADTIRRDYADKQRALAMKRAQTVGMDMSIYEDMEKWDKEMARMLLLPKGATLEFTPIMPAATCRGCGAAMRMHVGYCDNCVRAG